MIEYRFARPDEEADVLDLINLVFSQAHRPHHFDELIPKVYAYPEFSNHHALALVDGRMRATVALLPMEMRLQGGNTLRAGYVGSVSVHEKYRGQGHMKALMKMQLERAKELGLDFLALGGQRQRYGYWGFECGGMRREFHITPANMRHALKDEAVDSLMIRPLEEDDPVLDEIYDLRQAQPSSFDLPRERLFDALRCWNLTPYVLLDAEEGSFQGYFTANGNDIMELALVSESQLLPFLKQWVTERGCCAVHTPPYLPRRAAILKTVAESYSIGDAGMLKILNWPRVLTALLTLSQSIRPLPDGTFRFEIVKQGAFEMKIQGGQASVQPTTEAPERLLTERQAVELFFSPYAGLEESNPLLRYWLPLPLCFLPSDRF